ncbi:MAG: flagellar basal body rod protein FlgF, partial [Thermoplasmata archaeon]
ANTSHNLANASTPGFRAQLDSFRAVPVISDGLPTRVFVVDSTVGTDFTPGTIHSTGRALDMALQGKGWMAVQMEDGSEAYTRNGSLNVSENGVLQTLDGRSVLGDGGAISIPPDVTIEIGTDGTVSGVSASGKAGIVNVLGRIKLVNPPEDTMTRGDDGFFRTTDGAPATADSRVKVVSGALEDSNVKVIDAMVNMISLGRQFDLHMKMLQSAEENSSKAGQVLGLSS